MWRFPLLILLRLLMRVFSTSHTAVDVVSQKFESTVQPDYLRILRLDQDEMWVASRGKLYFMDPKTMQIMYERAWGLTEESIKPCEGDSSFVVCDYGWPTVAYKITIDTWYIFGTGGGLSICRELARVTIDVQVREWLFREPTGTLLQSAAQVVSPPFPWIHFRAEPDSESDEEYHMSLIIYRTNKLRTITGRMNVNTVNSTVNSYYNTNPIYSSSIPHDSLYNRQYDVLGIYQDKHSVYITIRDPFLAVRQETIIMRWCKKENFALPSGRLIQSKYKLRLRCQQEKEQIPQVSKQIFPHKFGGVVGNYSVEFKQLGATVVYLRASNESRIHGKSGTLIEVPSQSTTAIPSTADKNDVVFVGVFNIDMGVSTAIKYPGSSVCSFTQRAVDSKFDTVRQVELSNGSTTERDNRGFFCERAQPAAEREQSRDLDDLLLEKLQGDLLYEDNQEIAKLTALAVDTSVLAADGYDYDVLFAGTSDGRLIQLSSKPDGTYHRSNIRNIKPGKQIERVRIYHGASQKHLVVNSFERVDKLNLTLCEIHVSCVSCVEARDPYCAWSIDLVKCVDVKEILKGNDSDVNTIRGIFSKLLFYNDANRNAIDIDSRCGVITGPTTPKIVNPEPDSIVIAVCNGGRPALLFGDYLDYSQNYDVLGIHQTMYSLYISIQKPADSDSMQPFTSTLYKLRLQCTVLQQGQQNAEFNNLGATVMYTKASNKSRIHGSSGILTMDTRQSTTFIYRSLNTTNIVFVGVFTLNRATGGTSVCSYTLDDVDQLFSYESDIRFPDGTIDDSKRKSYGCAEEQNATADDIATLHGKVLFQDFVNRGTMTALAVDTSTLAADGYDYDVLLIGTDDGRLIQISSSPGEQYYLSNVREVRPGKRIESIRVYHTLFENKITVTTEETVYTLNTEQCDSYGTCGSCVGARDPYCAWSAEQMKCVSVQNILGSSSSDVNTISDIFSKLIFYNDFNRRVIDIDSSCVPMTTQGAGTTTKTIANPEPDSIVIAVCTEGRAALLFGDYLDYSQNYDVLGIYQTMYILYISVQEPLESDRMDPLISTLYKIYLHCTAEQEQGNVDFDNLGATVMYTKASNESRIQGSGILTMDTRQSTTLIHRSLNARNVVFVGIFNRDEEISGPSSVCSYTLEDVDQQFVVGSGIISPDGTIDDSKRQSYDCSDESVSTSSNPIATLHGGLLFEDFKNERILTALAVDTSILAADGYEYDVLLIGTDDGKLIQLSSSPDGKYYMSNVQEIQPGKRIERVEVYHTSFENKVTVITKETVDTLNTEQCDSYGTCGSCVEARDPYCAWSTEQRGCVSVKYILDSSSSNDLQRIREIFSQLIFYTDFTRRPINIPSACKDQTPREVFKLSTGLSIGVAAIVLIFCGIWVVIIVMWVHSSKKKKRKHLQPRGKITTINPRTSQNTYFPVAAQSVVSTVRTQPKLQPQPPAHRRLIGGAGVDKLYLPQSDSERSSALPLKIYSDEVHAISEHDNVQESKQQYSNSSHHSNSLQQSTRLFSETRAASTSQSRIIHVTKSKKSLPKSQQSDVAIAQETHILQTSDYNTAISRDNLPLDTHPTTQ